MKNCRSQYHTVLQGVFAVLALVGTGGGLMAGSVAVDFATATGTTSTDATAPDGWTYSSIGRSDGVACFNALADFMVSPVFGACVTNVSLVCKCSAADATRLLRIVPLTVTAGGVTTNEGTAVVCTSPPTTKTTWRVAFAPELGVNAFRIGLTGSGSTGNWALYSACVAHMGADAPIPLAAPTGILAASVESNAFTLSWNPVAGATGYGVKVWRESEAPPTGTATLYASDLAALANEGGNPREITGSIAEIFGAGWSGSSVYVPAKTGGCVQLGTGKASGWLLSPGLGDPGNAACTLVLRAKRYLNDREGTAMPVDRVRGATTNALATFTLGDDWAWHAAPLADLAAGDRLLLHSLTNGSGRRALISSVQVLADYAPGVVTTNDVRDLTGWGTTSMRVDRLAAGGSYRFAVRAERDGEDGPWSAPGTVALAVPHEDEHPTGDAAVPTGLEATRVTTNAFTVAWNPVAGATEYLVTVVTNVVVPEREGEVLWQETFPRVTQAGSGSWPLDVLNILTDWTSWRGTNIFPCASTGQVVQLGNTSVNGWLATGPLGVEGTGRVLKFRAWRNEGRNMPFEVVDEVGGTNLAADVVLGSTPEVYRLELPPLSPGDGLVFHSTTNAQRGRVSLGEMRILADDEPERTNTLTVVENLSTAAPTASFAGLSPTVAYVQVAAVVGTVTNASAWLEIDLAGSVAGAWRVSQFVGGMKEESCGWVTNVSQRTAWENGETLPGFHAFMNGEAVAAIGYDSGQTTAAGLYASSTNGGAFAAHSLSLRASGEREVAVELRIVNDAPTRKAVSGATLEFLAHQWSFPGAGVRTLVAEWAVTDGTTWPRDADWTPGNEDASFASADALAEDEVHRQAARTLRTGRILVPTGGFLCFRWRVAKATGSPMLGVSDVCVRIEFLKDPSILILR